MAEGLRMAIALDSSQLRLGVERMEQVGLHPRPLMEIAANIFENSTRARFDTESGPGGIPWPITWRKKETGGRILQDKGLLRGSIRSEVSDTEVQTGVDGRNRSAKYARTHQFGATIKPKRAKYLAFTAPGGGLVFATQVTIPARPFLGIDADDIEDLREAFVDYLGRAANGSR